VVLALAVACGALALWIHQDRFMDREEAQHVQRVFETREAAFGTAGRPPSLGVLLKARLDQVKPWYGWPYYLAVAAVWQLLGPGYDLGVMVNLLFLIVAAGCVGGVARRLGGEGAGAPAAVYLVFTPGILIWSHLFGPTPFLLAAFAATSLALLATDGWSRPGMSFWAGLLTAGTLVAKMSLAFAWLALALYVARPLLTAAGRRRAWPGIGLFALGLLPLPVSVWINRAPLAFWAVQARALYRQGSASETLYGIGVRTLDVFLPFHLALAAAGLLLLLRAPSGRRLAGFLAFWAAMSALGVVALLGNSGTTRDHDLTAIPLAVAVGAGLATLRPRWRQGAVAAMLAYAAVLIPVNLFGVGVGLQPPAGWFGWLHTDVDGAPWGIRLAPYPDLVEATIARLRVLLPPGAQGRCGCLPARPYPVANAAGRPVVALDSRLLGPENLDAAFMLRGETDPWQVGYVPYPLSCAPLQTALACTSAIVYAGPPLAAEFAGAEDRVAARRTGLAAWGRPAGDLDFSGIGRLSFRVATGPPLCPLPAVTAPPAADAWRRVAAGCPEDDYYARFLDLQFGASAPTAVELRLARSLTRARLADLQANGDTPALVFGEGYLAQWTLDALDHLAAAPPRAPAGTGR
jgi:hypothetical protein